MLWLPGWGMDESAWGNLPDRFPEAHHCFPRYELAETAEDLYAATLLRLAEVRRPVVAIGWSLGGLIGLRLAAEGQVDGLVLIASTARFVRSREEADRGWSDAVLRRMMTALGEDRSQVMASFRRSLLSPEETAAGADTRFSAGDRWSTGALMAGLTLLRTWDVRPLLPRIGVPAAIVHGTADPICPWPAAEELADGLSGSVLVRLEGAGHVPFLTRPDPVGEAIQKVGDTCA